MPGALVDGDELQQRAVAPHEEVRRHLQAADRLVVRVRVPVEPVGEEALDGVAAVLAGRQADRMHDGQRHFGRRRARAAVRRRALPRRAPPAAAPGAAAVNRFRHRRADAQPRHAVAHLAQRQAEAGAGRGAVVAVAQQRTFEDVALDRVEVGHEVAGQRCRGGRLGRSWRLRERSRHAVGCVVRQGAGVTGIEVGAPDGVAGGQRQRTVQQVLQLAHVAGEGLPLQPRQHVGRQRGHGVDPGIGGDAAQHRVADRRQVAHALAQRRHDDADDVEPVVQVLAEAAGLHLGRQVLVRGAEDAHVDRHLGRPAQRPHGALLDDAQQLALHGQRQVADLVEEQRAALGGLEEALAVFRRTGEGALAVAEELGLQQVLRDGAAVDGDEGLRGARRDLVDGARHQFLAGARFAVQQHRRHAARDLADQRAHLLHGGRVAGQPLQGSDRRLRPGVRGGARRRVAPAAAAAAGSRPSAEATTARNCRRSTGFVR
jgi:hypothetical protein